MTSAKKMFLASKLVGLRSWGSSGFGNKSTKFAVKPSILTFQRTYKKVLPFDPLYDPDAIVDIQASYRTVKGRKGCKALRKQNIVPGIVEGGIEKSIMVQCSKFPIEKLLNTTGFMGKKYCLNFDNGDKVYVQPSQNRLHHLDDYPAWITWARTNPIKKEKVKTPKPVVYKKFTDTLVLGHPIFTVKRSCKSIEAREHFRRRRLLHIHDLIGIPKAVPTRPRSQTL